MGLYMARGVQLPTDVQRRLEVFDCYRCGGSQKSVRQARRGAHGTGGERWTVDTECLWCGLAGRYFTHIAAAPPDWWWSSPR